MKATLEFVRNGRVEQRKLVVVKAEGDGWLTTDAGGFTKTFARDGYRYVGNVRDTELHGGWRIASADLLRLPRS